MNTITCSKPPLCGLPRVFNTRGIATSSLVRTVSSVEPEHINGLIHGSIKALRVPNYCSKEVSRLATEKLLSRNVVDYANAPGVGKVADVGMAYFETIEDKNLEKQYYEVSRTSLDTMRALFSPYVSPLDKLRLELDERWKHGAHLLNLGKGPMFTGLVRVLKQDVLPHEDKLERDHHTAREDIGYVGQIALNVYLQLPKIGGEVQLWDLSYDDEIYNELRGDSYGISKDKLPPPALEIKPEVGELILFNPRNLHAVNGSAKGDLPRVSYSSFIFYGGNDKPLRFWS